MTLRWLWPAMGARGHRLRAYLELRAKDSVANCRASRPAKVPQQIKLVGSRY